MILSVFLVVLVSEKAWAEGQFASTRAHAALFPKWNNKRQTITMKAALILSGFWLGFKGLCPDVAWKQQGSICNRKFGDWSNVEAKIISPPYEITQSPRNQTTVALGQGGSSTIRVLMWLVISKRCSSLLLLQIKSCCDTVLFYYVSQLLH